MFDFIKLRLYPFLRARPILILTVLAVLFRFYLLLSFTPACCGSDEGTYHSLAINLLRKGQFVYTINDDSGIWKNIVYGAKPPLYPFFLYVIYRTFGINTDIVKFIQIGLSAVTGLLIYQTIKEMSSQKAGIWGLIVYSFFWETAHMSLTLMSENLYWFLLSLLIVLVIQAREHSKNNYLFIGAVLGLETLNRPTSFSLLIPVVVWLMWNKFNLKMIKNIFILCFFCLLTLVPWTLRNYQVYKQLVFVYTDGGLNFWMGNHPNSGGSYNIPNPDIPGEIPVLKTSGVFQEIERDRYYFGAALAYVKKYPLETIDTDIRKVFRTFYLYRPIVLNETNVRGSWFLIGAGSLAINDFWEIYASYGFATVVIISVFGMLIMFKAKPKFGSIEVLLFLIFVWHLLAIAFSIWTPRYVTEIYTVMIPFGAVFLSDFYSKILKRHS